MRYIKTATMSVTLLLCMAQSAYSHPAEIETSDYQALIESILDKAAVPFSGSLKDRKRTFSLDDEMRTAMRTLVKQTDSADKNKSENQH